MHTTSKRRGGRPPTFRKTVALRFDPHAHAELRRCAIAQRKSMSDVVLKAVATHIKQYESRRDIARIREEVAREQRANTTTN